MLSNALSSCLLFSGGGARFSEQLSHLGSLRNKEGAKYSRSEDKTSLAEEERSEDAPLSFARK